MSEDDKRKGRPADEEMQKILNADLERIRSGKGPDIRGPLPDPKTSIISLISATLKQALIDSGDARATFDALMARGHSKEIAFDLMGRAMYCCMKETALDMADRWPSVLQSLREGRSLEELFPDALYETPEDKGN